MKQWNTTENKHYPTNRRIEELFSENVSSNPDAVALVFGDEHVSFLRIVN